MHLWRNNWFTLFVLWYFQGIGYRVKDGRVWFTYNGKFLNEMLSAEKKALTKEPDKDKKEKPSKKDKEKEPELTEEESKFK